jgi:NitT/TauT family transport system substrate-binding protein
VDLLLERRIQAATVFGTQKEVLEQQGVRKMVDATFMIGFLIQPGTATEDVEKYFRALRRAQRDIDLEPEPFRHYDLHEIPDMYKPMVDVRAFSSGERMVFEPYTQQVYEKTHRWMAEHNFLAASQAGTAGFA